MNAPLIHWGNCIEWLASLADKSIDHCITDPPYDEKVHGAQRRQKLVRDRRQKFRGVRATSLGFNAITREEMAAVSFHLARVVRGWSLIFCSAEMTGNWREAYVRYGLEHVRIMPWIKIGCTPQFTGDRPAAAWEAICVAHPRGRKRWNAGGKRGVYTHSIVTNRGGKHARDEEDTTPKPIPLMLELVDDFTLPGELVIDPFAGMGNTGIACLRRGRRFLGCEIKKRKAHLANESLLAELDGISREARAAGQLPVFPGVLA